MHVRAGRCGVNMISNPPTNEVDAVPKALELKNLTKSFGATKALDGVSFSVRKGSAHALLGENGAGKSTTIKLLSGLIRPDAGEIFVSGTEVHLHDARDAHSFGLQTAFQELTLVPDLSVIQNMLLPYEPLRFAGQIDRKASILAVQEHFEKIGLRGIDVRCDVRDLSLNERQRLEIARALFRRPDVLLLDEATSTLLGPEVEWLGDLIQNLKSNGVTVVMITHKMLEVFDYCEHVTVLRNGRNVGSFETSQVERNQLVELIIGRSLKATYPEKVRSPQVGGPILSLNHVGNARRLVDCSFSLWAGEILGIAGLQGMGQNDLFMTLFGAMPLVTGTIDLDGHQAAFGSPRQAINAGLALVPEERKTEGLFLELTGRENTAASILRKITRFGIINGRLETQLSSAIMKRVQVDQRALYRRAGSFSGGNQQKLVLAKALLTEPRILLLFDPCRGVDVGTKHEIYQLIMAFAAEGGAVLLYSSETPELVNLCSRVIVMYGGRDVGVIATERPDLAEAEIMSATLGHAHQHDQAGTEVGLQRGAC